MKTTALGLIFLLSATFGALNAQAQIYTSRPNDVACNNGFAVLGGPFSVFGMVKEVHVTEWRKLTDSTLRDQILEQALQEGLAVCGTAKAAQIAIFGDRQQLVVAWTMLNPRHWTIVKDNVLAEIQREDARIAREQAEQERMQRTAQAQRAAADTAEQRKHIALADCGPAPSVSGGPWFSSTYKAAVRNEIVNITRGIDRSFFCIKSVEYLGAAPNPFGGNAARAKFTGYDPDNLNLTTREREFPY